MTAITRTVTVFAEVTVQLTVAPSPAKSVPSVGVAVQVIPGCAPGTETVPLAEAPTNKAEPPMLPVVPVRIGWKFSPVCACCGPCARTTIHALMPR